MTQPARPSGDKIRMIEVGGTEIFIVRSKWGHILPASFASDEEASAAVGAEEKEIEIVADGNVTGGRWQVARIPTESDHVYVPYDSEQDEFSSEGYWSLDEAEEAAAQKNNEDTSHPTRPSSR
jgi:hypothetical protein